VRVYSELLRDVSVLPKVLEEDNELIEQFKSGNRDAGHKLFRRHYKLIVKIVLQSTSGRWYSDDCLQAGAVGLYDAALRFDPARGAKFTTYAYNWIRKWVLLEVCSDLLPAGGVCFSSSFKDKLFRYIGNRMSGLTDEEIMEKMRITPIEFHDLEEAASVTIPLHMDADQNDEETSNLDRFQNSEEPSIESAEDSIVNEESYLGLRNAVFEAISQMPNELRVILESSLGLNNQLPKRSHELAKILHVSIPQILVLKREANRQLKKIIQTYLKEEEELSNV